MVLLAFESAGLYEHLDKLVTGTVLRPLVRQFYHHPWHGLRFWDLIQPGFMFLAGISMAFSLHKQEEIGMRKIDSFKKMVKRCALLFFFGVTDYAIEPNGNLQLDLSDVLTQLSFTLFIAFLIFRWSIFAQISCCVLLLFGREALYRWTNIDGFNQPFVNQHNFGNYMEQVLVKRINPEGWVSINWIPTAVHTIAGALIGKLLLSSKDKFLPMIKSAIICLIIGYALDKTGTVPIIKRIATTSFVLVSLGYCILAFALTYFQIDMKHSNKHFRFFTIVGMNSLFMYLFFEIVGTKWLNGYVAAIMNGLSSLIHLDSTFNGILSSLTIFAIEWELCYFLYRKRLFIRV